MSNSCPRCDKPVYFAEEARALGKKFHKKCLKCFECKKSLDSANCNDHEGEIYCNSCYRKNFGAKGYGFAGGAAGLSGEANKQNGNYNAKIPTSMSTVGGADRCPHCDQAVYFAEEVRALGKKYHKLCLKCAACKKMLDSINCNDHDGDLYCNACYKKNFATKGYGFAGGAAGLSAEPGENGDSKVIPGYTQAQACMIGGSPVEGGDVCPRCQKAVYAAEKVIGAGKTYHKLCFRCMSCGKGLDSTSLCTRDEDIFCKACYGKNFGPKGYGFAGGAAGLSMDTGKPFEVTRDNVSHLAQAQTAALFDDGNGDGSGEKCAQCNKTVYFAEKIQGGGKVYHKSCFKCAICNKSLDSMTLTERDEQIFCKNCYSKNFGPKGFGYGTTLQHTA